MSTFKRSAHPTGAPPLGCLGWLLLLESTLGCGSIEKPSVRGPQSPPTAEAAPPPQTETPLAPPPAGPFHARKQDLPLAVRDALGTSMHRHGQEMTFLLASVVLLDYPQVEELAEMIANDPRLGRPAPGDTQSLNALLPEAFFEHQDALTERSRALAEAARSQDDQRLADTFGALTKTCIACHSTYMKEEFEGIPHGDEDL